VNVFRAVLWKDLVVEWRSRDRVVAMTLFAALAVILFWFSLPVESPEQRRAAVPGLLWIVSLFASLLGLNRSFSIELEDDTLSALAMVPVDRGFVFLGKAAANWIFLFVVLALTFAFTAFAFSIDIGHAVLPFLLVAALGSLGLASLGTLFAAIAVRTRFREVMLPLLALPLLIPVLLSAVAATRVLLESGALAGAALKLLIVTDAVYLIVSFVTFDFVLDE
jgi:heme exporter protein B